MNKNHDPERKKAFRDAVYAVAKDGEPFSRSRKRLWARNLSASHPDDPLKVRILVKGAPDGKKG